MTDYTVGDYLLDRLVELGVSEVFGVPGDFNLEFLDHIVTHESVRWVGNANELNAGYAADGYGRIRGISALVTTFGVGELSAANAIAGSYAEHVPVVHIVGAPSKDAQAAHRVVHHSLGDGDFGHFLRVAREFTCAQADLEAATATEEIDRVLLEVHQQKLPGYLLLSTDVARFPADPPSAPLLSRTHNATSPLALSEFIEMATALIDDQQVTVLADLMVHRLGAVDALDNLITRGNVPYATLMWGKSMLDESRPNFLGIYTGAASEESVRTAVEDAPVLIMAGVQFTDLVSGFFTQHIDPTRTIVLDTHEARIGNTVVAPLDMRDALDALTMILQNRDVAPTYSAGADRTHATRIIDDDAQLSQETLWDKLSEGLTSGNIVLADQGTSFYGMAAHRLPTGVTFIGQPLWASIGYTLPAALGAAVAAPGRRTVLLIGDGAAQLTMQELGTFAREDVNPVVVVVNNNGYTVERAIHGDTAHYNDISTWDWQSTPSALGVTSAQTFRASTPRELDAAFTAAIDDPDRMTFIEAVVPTMDVPPLLSEIAQSAAKANAAQSN